MIRLWFGPCDQRVMSQGLEPEGAGPPGPDQGCRCTGGAHLVDGGGSTDQMRTLWANPIPFPNVSKMWDNRGIIVRTLWERSHQALGQPAPQRVHDPEHDLRGKEGRKVQTQSKSNNVTAPATPLRPAAPPAMPALPSRGMRRIPLQRTESYVDREACLKRHRGSCITPAFTRRRTRNSNKWPAPLLLLLIFARSYTPCPFLFL